jgi:hypothetical protein
VTYINHLITGVPYPKDKASGDTGAPARWTAAIKDQTKGLPRVREACFAKITFFLPPNKFPRDVPYGPDLDNLLKRFMDALNGTVFADAPGRDSCIIALTAMKTRVESEDAAGAHLEILPVSLDVAEPVKSSLSD